MEDRIVSVKELNQVLSNEELSGTFTEVDIVFVAGLFLRYMQNKKQTKMSFRLEKNDNERWKIHSNYFKQIVDLYEVKDYQITSNFPNINIDTASPVSESFAPPIYITNKSIDYFFGANKNKRIDNLKEKYISKLKEQKSNSKEANYFADTEKENIIQTLKSYPPIHTFIFSVAYHKINPFVSTKKKGFESGEDGIERLWQFTKEYVRGLHELARNIVEHSGQGENDGQGMITIRAYNETSNDNKKIKVLETHVFDYGEKGIYKTLLQNTEEKKTKEGDDVYTKDYDTLIDTQKKYTIKDFIGPTDNEKFLLQQFYREMAHYGLMSFKDLIAQYDGKIIASSVREENEKGREEYVFPESKITEKEIEEHNITKGTSYYFEMPFIPSLFNRKSKTTQAIGNQSIVAALSNLQKYEFVEYKEIANLQPNQKKTYIINIKVKKTDEGNYKIDSRETENNVCKSIIDTLASLQIEKIKDNDYVAVDFDGVTLDKSSLLRILARLSREKLPDFIVCNVKCEVFIGLIEENKKWFEHIKDKKDKLKSIDNKNIDDSYWFKNKSILLFTKYEKEKKHFYFADFLFGETAKDFNSINTIVSNTFPNTTCIERDPAKFETDDNFSIPPKIQERFFYGNYLLPFDTLLKIKSKDDNSEPKELFLFNIDTILNNELFGRDSYTDIDEYVENFEGYRIKNTHFKIGNKVHSADFYYAKRLFQNSFYTTRLAMYLAKKINQEIEDANKKNKKSGITKQIDKITLAGYEMYSELILSLTEKFLRDIYRYEDVNHFVAQNKDEKLTFLPESVFNKYLKDCKSRKIIIVVPIAATGNTAKKIETEIRNRYKKENSEELKEDLFIPYNILLAQPREGFVDIKNPDKNQRKIINLTAKWHRIKDCPLCYGVDENGNEIKTLPLFDTDSSSLTPSLIFENPKGQTKSTQGNQIDNIITFDRLDFQGSIEYQSVNRNENYRIYDVDSDKFIEDNKSKIVDWLKFTVKLHLEGLANNETKEKIISYQKSKIDKIEETERKTFFKEYEREEDTLEEYWFEQYVFLYKNDAIKSDALWQQQLDDNFNQSEEGSYLKSTDKVVIVAPCHESNSQFINLINENVFSSSATIIHHQKSVDFAENFNLLNKNYLTGENTKIFYVDDSLITGTHFFEVFGLIKDVVPDRDLPLTASIFINDQATPFVHNRVVELSKNHFAFATYNLPQPLNILAKKPLEYEYKRYDLLKNSALHDALCEHFCEKTEKLNPDKPRNDKDIEKQIRRLKMFEATHKIYDYFAKNPDAEIADLDLSKKEDRENFVKFELNYKTDEEITIDKTDTETKALFKVLCQYPFILYRDLRTATFEWHTKLLDELREPNDRPFDLENDDYERFSTFKFHLRRASFLGNYQILEVKYLKKLSAWFNKIDVSIEDLIKMLKEKEEKLSNLKKELLDLEKKSQSSSTLPFEKEQKKQDVQNQQLKYNELQKIVENLRDFPIFVLGNYVEMIQKNSWVAYKILYNINEDQAFLSELKKSRQGKQFFNMLQLEASTVINEFVEIASPKWQKMYKDIPFNEIYSRTDRLVEFFKDKTKDGYELLNTNKYELVKETFLQKTDDWIDVDSPFINFLRIKQIIEADKKTEIKIPYDDKIKEIIKRMTGFFKEEIEAFFIAVDGKHDPHILSPQDNSILNKLKDEFAKHKSLKADIEELKKKIKQLKNNKDTNSINEKQKKEEALEKKGRTEKELTIDFLEGILCNTKNAPETTAEFVFEKGEWTNIYDIYNEDKDTKLKFMSPEYGYKWLYLIRISKHENKHRKCELEPQGLLGFYSKENLRNSILPKQLLMLLRQDMGEFIDNHHKNDEFAELMISHKIRDFYEDNFTKFGHDAGRFIDKYRTISLDKQSDNDTDKILFSLGEIIFGNMYFSNCYAEYLKKLSENKKWKPQDRGRVAHYKDKHISEIKNIVSGINHLYSGTILSSFNISIVNFENIQSRLHYMHLKEIIIELICNATKNPAGTNRFVAINCYTDKIICTSRNGKVDDVQVNTLLNNIRRSRPNETGIGLFIIEKIIFSTFNKHIELDYDSETNIFKVTIPLN